MGRKGEKGEGDGERMGMRLPLGPCHMGFSSPATCLIGASRLEENPRARLKAQSTLPNHRSDIPSPLPHSVVRSKSLGLALS